jgi:cellulose synthase/poly-beta-1,6-N-acetylglucosamine synthase-like glycosyltransferase
MKMGVISPRVSIIVPSYKSKENLKKCLHHCLKLNYDDFEIIVAGNIDPLMHNDNIVWLHVDDESQGSKRNAAIAKARGEICAFIDDDAFPHRDWLRNSVKYFKDLSIGAVSGPGIPPDDENLMERGSSAVLASYLGTGPARYRYTPCKQRFVQDAAPAYNLLVRRDLLLEIGGFPTGIRAAEDTLLSAKIRNQGKKILYANDVIVYHKRRPLFAPLARQIGNYALHRGFLSKKYRGLRNLVFILFSSIVVAFLVAVLVLLSQFSYFTLLYVGMLVLIYLAASYLSGLLASRSGSVAVLAMFGIPLIHLTYVVQFFRGLVTRQLNEKPSY